MKITFTKSSYFRNRFLQFAGLLIAGVWSGSVTAQYCTPATSNGCSFGDQITDFSTTGGTTNITNNGTACSPGNYAYITGQTVTVPAGGSFSFSVTSGPTFSQGQKIWVDWNNDLDFTDPGEDVWTSSTWTTTAQTGTITIPNTVGGGVYRMRVRCSWNSLPTDPCANQTYGEVEDYDVTVLSPAANDAGVAAIVSPALVACALDTNVIINVGGYGTDTLNSATINWSLNGVTQPTVSWTGSLAQGEVDSNVVVATNVTYSVGDVITIWTSMPNMVPDSGNTNDTMTIVVPPLSLNGTYTIDAGQATGGVNFNSFSDAVFALNSVGVCGPVVFNVADGTYNEQIEMIEIVGADNVNTVEFVGNTTNMTSVNLTYAAFSSTDNYTLKMDGTDWVTFRDMTISGTGATFTRVMEVTNGASHNTFQKVIFSGDLATTTTSFNKIVIYSNTGNDDDNHFMDNEIRGGSYGMYWYGSSTTNLESGSVIENNLFTRQYQYGIRAQSQDNMKFRNNVFSTLSTYNFTSYGFYFGFCDNALEVTGNRIESINQVPTFGVYLSSCDGTATMKGLVANNSVSLGDSTSTNGFTGIYLTNSGHQNIVHNSVAIFGTSTFAEALYVASGGANVIKNNIFANFGTGTAAYINSSFAVTEMDNNNHFSLGTNLSYFNGNQATMSDFQSASGFDLNGVNVDPLYYNPIGNDLHVCNGDLDGTGSDLDSLILEDFDGETRSLSAPDIGADEFTSIFAFSLGADTTILCAGDSLTLNGVPGAQNIWSTTDTADFLVITTTGVYSVDVTNNCGTLADTVNVQTNTPASLPATQNICANASATLNPGVANGTYNWSTSETTATISIAAAGTYSVNVMDAFGCSSTASTVVTQSVETDLPGDTTICTGDNLTLDAGIPGSTYAWTPNAQTTQTISVNTPATYGVTVTDQFNCVSSDQITVTTQDPAVAGFSGSISYLTTSFSNSSTNATSFTWMFGDGNTSTDSDPVHVYPQTGTYTVMLIASNFCGSDTLLDTVTTSITGIQELNNETLVSMFPNPTDGNFTLMVDAASSATFQVEVMDLQGRVVFFQNLGQISGTQNQDISLGEVAAGIYMVKVSSGGESVVQKLTVH